eukprot:scaffold7069_cov368-Pinguiococcus_pyrenoidosus.AAC.2
MPPSSDQSTSPVPLHFHTVALGGRAIVAAAAPAAAADDAAVPPQRQHRAKLQKKQGGQGDAKGRNARKSEQPLQPQIQEACT